MRAFTVGTVVQHLRLASSERTDADLIRAFAYHGDSSAFVGIVQRHGPMVLGVCRRILGDGADAEDAFQATFLVLMRKARTLRKPDLLSSWLHEVARRTAMKIRTSRINRQSHQKTLTDFPAGESDDVIWREMRPILDAELADLPEKLRVPAILCFLQGHSKSEAARSLGWPEGTLSVRLQRARERLRVRLTARGLTLSAATFTAAIAERIASSAVPESLLASTLNLTAISQVAEAGVQTLADGVLRTMLIAKVKTLAASVLVVSAIGTGTGLMLSPGHGDGLVFAGETPGEKGPAPREMSAKTVSPEIAEQITLVRKKMKQEEADADWFGRRAQGRTDDARAIAALTLSMRRMEQLRLEDAVARGDAKREELDRLNRQMTQLEETVRSLPVRTPEERKLDEVTNRAVELQNRANFVERMVMKGYMSPAELKKVQAELSAVEAEEKSLLGQPRGDRQRAVAEADLKILKGRLRWEEAMVGRQFMSGSQVKKTKEEIERLETFLKKPANAGPEAIRDEAADLVRRMQAIVTQTRQGVEHGIVPAQELLKAEASLLSYKLQMLDELGTAKDSAERIEMLNSIVPKMEQIVEQTSRAVEKGVIPAHELFNVQRTLLEFKLKQLQANADKWDFKKVRDLRMERLRVKSQELLRLEVLLKQNSASLKEVQRTRIEMLRLSAEYDEWIGRYRAASESRDKVLAEFEAIAKDVRKAQEAGGTSHADVRAAEVAVLQAKAEAAQAQARRHLSEVVSIREVELHQVRLMFETRGASAEDVRQAEAALEQAKSNLKR